MTDDIHCEPREVNIIAVEMVAASINCALLSLKMMMMMMMTMVVMVMMIIGLRMFGSFTGVVNVGCCLCVGVV